MPRPGGTKAEKSLGKNHVTQRARRRRRLAKSAAASVVVLMFLGGGALGILQWAHTPGLGLGESTPYASQVTGPDAMARLAEFLDSAAGPGSEMRLRNLLGPAADLVVEPGPAPFRARQAPQSVGEALDQIAGGPVDRVPVPEAPGGPEPLATALHLLSDQIGADPPPGLLAASSAALRLQPESEAALARLLVAYVEALRLEDRALRDLSTQERLLVDGEAGAVSAWFAADDSRTAQDLEEHLEQLRSTRIDLEDRIRAADLLVRTIEEVKDDLALPAAPVSDTATDVGGRGGQSVAASDGSGVGSASAAAGQPWESRTAWEQIEYLVSCAGGSCGHTAVTDIPQESLTVAIWKLAWTLGYPPGPVPLPEVDLPLSLSNAIAGIVTARRIGIQSADPAVHSLLLLDATRRAEPTLRAWAALMELDEQLLNEPTRASSAPQILEAALGPSPSPSAILGARPELGDSSLAVDPIPLHEQLQAYGVPADAARQATATMPPDAALAVATALQTLDRFESKRASILGSLDADALAILQDTARLDELLSRPRWTTDQAEFVRAWAEAWGALAAQGGVANMQDAQIEAVGGIEDAVALLGQGLVPEGLPLPGTTAPMSSHAGPVDCPMASPLSDCPRDVWLHVPEGGLLITGFGSTTVDGRYGNPRLIVDLDGDDLYLGPAGAAGFAATSVVIDRGGHDFFRTSVPLAQGAASGLGALGVLWHLGGDNVYRHEPPANAGMRLAHGAASGGGVGILVDESGLDSYEASQSDAQGSAWGANGGGVGMLLDRGPGSDIFLADRGQGHATGTGAVGILVNEAGVSSYATTKGNPSFQGGVGDGNGLVGLLVDLGGKGTQYSNPPLADGTTFRAHEGREEERSDDALWVQRTPAGVGIGLDSTFSDDDEDRFSNLVELAGESDPDDPESTPGVDPNETIGAIEDLIENPPNPGDLLGDPGSLVADLSFSDELLCRDVECDEPMSVLMVLGTKDKFVNQTAHVLINLGGNDIYTTEVAGPGEFYVNGERHHGVGSFALDLSGDDQYATPGVDWTQGSVRPIDEFLVAEVPALPNQPSQPCVNAISSFISNGGPFPPAACEQLLEAYQEWAVSGAGFYADQVVALGDNRFIPPVSMLLDAAGNDAYEAGGHSQGSAARLGACTNTGLPGAAWLVDLLGDDSYSGGSMSQGAAEVGGGLGALLDLTGDDAYEFHTQGFTGTACNFQERGLFVDAGGTDSYTSVSTVVNTVGLTPQNPRNAFATQGNKTGTSPGVFVDHGETFDTYSTVNATGDIVDISHVKNDQLRPTITATSLPGTDSSIFSDGTLWFADLAMVDDSDGDEAPNFWERAFGTNRRDASDTVGSVAEAPGRLQDAAGDPTSLTPDKLLEASGLQDGSLWLRWPGVLAIGGRGDKSLAEAFPIVVSLGGANTYTAPTLGASLGQGVTLVVDAGDGDTTYAPDPARCVLKTGTGPVCPSLAAAVGGVAVLADAGGRNTFETMGSVDSTASGSVAYSLLTQGAAINHAVATLVTWDAENTFTARLAVNVKPPSGAAATVDVAGLAQGAATIGLGMLANFGSGVDSYAVEISGSGVTSTRSVGQGAADGRIGTPFTQDIGDPERPTSTPPPGFGDPNMWSFGGYGILIDSGGENSFQAPQGFSQGYGRQGMGVLWTGPGRDALTGGAMSQGVGDGPAGMGVLYDQGGSDSYDVVASGAMSEIAQGAGRSGGIGILVDAAGDDRFVAPGVEYVQGAGFGGHGILVSLGGNNLFRAKGNAQGFAGPDPATPLPGPLPVPVPTSLPVHPVYNAASFGLLWNAGSYDVYEIKEGLGQGAASSADDDSCAPGGFQALFVDTAGEDIYGHPDQDSKHPLPGHQRTEDGNNFAWSHPADPSPPCGYGVGIDSGDMDSAMEALRSLPLPLGIHGVSLSASTGGQPVGGGNSVAGDVLLEALVQAEPANPQLIDRVSFTSEFGPMGNGTFIDSDGSTLLYQFTWKTAVSRVPDGLYNTRATAFVSPGPSEETEPVGRPDAPPVSSNTVTFVVDNPPLLTVGADGLGSAPMIRPGQAGLGILINVGPDFKMPAGAQPDPRCQEGAEPGGRLEVAAKSASHEYTMFSGYCMAGSFSLPVEGLDNKGKPFKDGTYDLIVVLTDSSGQSTVVQSPQLPPLIVDAKSPFSAVELDAFANRANRGLSGSSLALPWRTTDFGGSGVAKACIFQLDANNNPTTEPSCVQNPPTSPAPLPIPGVETGDILRFLTSAEDRVGNFESPCDTAIKEQPMDASALCYRAKARDPSNIATILVDFANPALANVRASGGPLSDLFVGPGVPVNFTADASDVGSGLAGLVVQAPGMPATPMASDGRGHFWFAGWHNFNQGLHDEAAREEIFALIVSATDKAGNLQTESYAGVLDSLAPRVTVLDTEFQQPGGAPGELGAGRPGTTAVARALVDDAAIESVSIDTSAIGLAAAAECQPPTGFEPGWSCPFTLRPDVADGEHLLAVQAVDRAGNVASDAEVTVLVRSLPPEIEDVAVVDVGPFAFRVNWTTPHPGTSSVEYGRTALLGQTTSSGVTRTVNHSVEVTGLSPSTAYRFVVETSGESGLVARGPLLSVTTTNSYRFDFSDFPTAPIGGELNFSFSLSSPTASDPVAFVTKIEDVGRHVSPIDFASFSRGVGQGNITLDTTGFADGTYRLVLRLERAGDVATIQSPIFRIDNTPPTVQAVLPAPGALTSEPRPEFEIVVTDPGGNVAPLPSKVVLSKGGALIPAGVAEDEASDPESLTRHILVTPTQDLPEGHQQFVVSATDAAGNVGSATFDLTIDLSGPTMQDLQVRPYPGPMIAAAGGYVDVSMELADATGVAGGYVDMQALDASDVPLVPAGGRWRANLSIPGDAAAGSVTLPIRVTDLVGNEAALPGVSMTIDDQAPEISAILLSDTGFRGARISFATDEPTVAWVVPGSPAQDAIWSLQHELTADGLVPGLSQKVVFMVMDEAGNRGQASVDVLTRPDTEPPVFSSKQIRAISDRDGEVELSWSAASDNVAIDHYIVKRGQAPRAPPMEMIVPGQVTNFTDRQAPAGRIVVYQVVPVDLVGTPGKAIEVTVAVFATPLLSNATVTPDRGPSDEPFTFRVEYKYAGGQPADAVTVTVDGERYALALSPESPPCYRGCVFEGAIILQPSTLRTAPTPIMFDAIMGANSAELTFAERPFVTGASAQDWVAGGPGTPGLGGSASLLIFAAAAILFGIRRRRLG